MGSGEDSGAGVVQRTRAFLSYGKNLILGAGALAGAIAAILALIPKSSETLQASFADVIAHPEVTLEQYDAYQRSEGITGASRSERASLVPYRLAAYTGTPSNAPGTGGGEGKPSGEEPTTSPSTSTSTSTAPTTTTSTTPTSTETQPQPPPKQPSAKKKERRARTKPETLTKRQERSGAGTASSPPVTTPVLPTPPGTTRSATSPTEVQVPGAKVIEGSNVPHTKVRAVAEIITGELAAAERPGRTSPPEPGTGTTPTTIAPSPEAPAEATAPAGEAHIALPKECRSSCGATPLIAQALTADPDPVRAAAAVARIFVDSRADVIHHRRHPVGTMVSYTINLDGFAGSQALLRWTLISRASMQPLPQRWWRRVTAALIRPSVQHESISGSFWVPVPPQKGEYLVQLEALDAHGIPHATSESTPPFH